MQSNKSSRRGFFGKTLALLGAAVACSKAPAAAVRLSPGDLSPTFRLREIQDHLDGERWTVSYGYDYTKECGSVDLSKCAYYEFDLAGTPTTVDYDDMP